MIPALKALIVDYQLYYGLETIEEARKYIKKVLQYLVEQERGYIIFGKDKTKVTLPNSA